jgi:hypothetical protein
MGREQAVDHMTGLRVTSLAMVILYLLNPTSARSEWGPPIMFSFTSTLAYPAAKDLRPCVCINRKLTSSRGFRLFFFSFNSLNGSRDGSPPPLPSPTQQNFVFGSANLVNLQRTLALFCVT